MPPLLRRAFVVLGGLTCAVALASCHGGSAGGGSSSGGTTGSGGASSGGTTGSGGAPGSGGSASGGTTGSGGAPGSGGASSGGATASGGSTASGGTTASGGATGSGGTTDSGGSGSGGSGSGGSGSGGSGSGGTSGLGGTAGSGATTGGGGVGGWSLGASSFCGSSSFAVCESFEATTVGMTPGGDWSLPTTNYGTGTIAVASDDAARGTHSLKVTIPAGGNSAELYLQRRNLGALATAHYGRLFFKVQSPTTSLFVHWDLILGAGLYNGSNHRIRWGVTGTGIGTADANWAWIYNVEQGDFGTEARSVHPVLSQWMCVSWFWDATNQAARFAFDGADVPALDFNMTLPGGQAAQMPMSFATLSFGLAKYQNTDNPLVFWIDEIALDSAPITCDR